MKPQEKSSLPWFTAAADFFMRKYVAGLTDRGVEVTEKVLADVNELVRTRLAGLKRSTEASYKGKWFRWQAFAASRGMDAVPVTLVGTLLWLRQDLCYTVRMKNVQPYLSALNKCHEHLGLAAVAVGDDVVSTRKAIAAQQAALDGGRGGHIIRQRSLKGQVLVDELSGDEKVLRFPADAVDGLVPLIAKWELWRRKLGLDAGNPKESWYRLPGETKTWSWNVNQMNTFMGEVLVAVGVVAPDTFSYSWHSLRHCAASSCKAINVADSKIMWLHNWSSMQVAYATYIDPLCPATPACFRFYGWLLPPARSELPAGPPISAASFVVRPR